MRLGLNGATIMHTDLITEWRSQIEPLRFRRTRDAKLRPYLQDHTRRVSDFLKTVRIKPLNINALEPVTSSPQGMGRAEQRAEWFCTQPQVAATRSRWSRFRPKSTTRETVSESVKA